MKLFIFFILMTLFIYPFVFAGSFILAILICILNSTHGQHTPNPFVSPKVVYDWLRKNVTETTVKMYQWYLEQIKEK